MRKVIKVHIILVLMVISCGKTNLLMVYKTPVFNYEGLVDKKLYVTPAINLTNDNELNNAEKIFIKLLVSKSKKQQVIQPLYTFKMLNEKGMQKEYIQLRKGLRDRHSVNKRIMEKFYQACGNAYLVFIKILNFTERRETKRSCLFPDTHKDEQAVRASLSGSVTIIDFQQGAIVFDTLHKVQYVYNRGNTDSLYSIDTDRRTIIERCLTKLFEEIQAHFPEKGEAADVFRKGKAYGWRIHAECVSGDCVDAAGELLYDNGDHYRGQFKNGNKHGQGIYRWKNGRKFDGKWKNDKKNGPGVLYDRNGDLVRKGIWKNGKFSAK